MTNNNYSVSNSTAQLSELLRAVCMVEELSRQTFNNFHEREHLQFPNEDIVLDNIINARINLSDMIAGNIVYNTTIQNEGQNIL